MKLFSTLAVAFLAVSAFGQTTNMVASHLGADLTQTPFTGRICVTPMLADRATAFSADGAAQVLPTRTCYPINAGVLNAVVPDTSLANPPIGLAAVIQDANGFNVYPYPQLLFPSGATFNLDSYAPTQTVKVTTPTFSFFSAPPSGDCGSAAAEGYSGTVSNVSTWYCIAHQWALQTGTGGGGTQVNSDWLATSGVAQILNKPTLATVATSGSYADLTNKPTLATVATSGSYNDLSNKPTLGTAAAASTSAFDAAGAATSAAAAAQSAAESFASGLTGNYDAAGSASAAETAAKSFASSLASNYDPVGSASAALVSAKSYTDTQIAGVSGGGSNPIGAAGGDLSGTYPNPNVAKINGATPGDIVTHNAAEFDLANAASAAQSAAEAFTTSAVAAYFPLTGGSLTGAVTINLNSTNSPLLSLGTGNGSTNYEQISGNRLMFGYYSTAGHGVFQSSTGVDFDTSTTFGSGRVGGFTAAGIFQWGSSNQFAVSAAGVASGPTPISSDNSTDYSTTAYVQGAITALSLGTASTHAATDFDTEGAASSAQSAAEAASDPAGTSSAAIAALANVARSGSYIDLTDKPTIPAAQVQSDWNAASGLGVVLNKPTLGTAAAASTSAFDAAGAATSAAAAAEAASDPTGSASTALSSAEAYSANASNISSGTLNHARLPALVSADIPANSAPTSSTAANLSGTPALPNGTTAATQTAGDNSNKLATTSYVATAVAGLGGGSSTTVTGSGLTTGDIYAMVSGVLTLAEGNTSTLQTNPAICLATSATQCQFGGVWTTTGLTANAVYYVSDTAAGAITATEPTTSGHYVQRLGVAISTTQLLLIPSLDVAGIQ